ncbi:MAG: cytochrome c oxidase accessory protein CcoG [Deltaproteobacteria bacterium]|nr:cytochrome c oxidase accessory protein CcoG [Deltaproteobacteria bacterium]
MSSSSLIPPNPDEPVLSTLNVDGSRRRLDPKLWRGVFFKRRAWVAYSLIALFSLIPYIKFNGKPLILLDLQLRQFTFFGVTLLPTDTVLLMLLGLGIVIAIFLLTALFGRVWCGWACPQTVYMEFLYRPIERLVLGKNRKRGDVSVTRRLLKQLAFVLISAFLAHTFLAYFVGVDRLFYWVQRSPVEHPAAFLVMLATTALMFLDFGWFREQTCLVACPYGRFQSVLLDRRSLIVGYDERRGEPRGKLKQAKAAADLGDCIDCRACVATCPTGVDIRRGLQMECIHCTQCIDACDAMMTKVGRPTGLIRYASQDELEGAKRGFLRPRVIVYPAILLVVALLFGWTVGQRGNADVTLLRGIGAPFSLLGTGQVSNQIRIKVVNRSGAAKNYRIELLDFPQANLVAPQNPLPAADGETARTSVFVIFDRKQIAAGVKRVRFRVSDGQGFEAIKAYRLLGPKEAS